MDGLSNCNTHLTSSLGINPVYDTHKAYSLESLHFCIRLFSIEISVINTPAISQHIQVFVFFFYERKCIFRYHGNIKTKRFYKTIMEGVNHLKHSGNYMNHLL
jgi:hypothetical protein